MDLEKFEEDLFIYGSAAFARIRSARPNDRFYCFGFYTSGEFAYVLATASSYEGLEAVAARYQSKARNSNRGIDSLKKSLKWSPCDSPLHAMPEGEMKELESTMNGIASKFYEFDLDVEESGFHRFVDEIYSAFANALRRIDETGLFGVGDERPQVVVNILLGDQSDEDRLAFASALNSPDVVERFAREQEEGLKEFMRHQL